MLVGGKRLLVIVMLSCILVQTSSLPKAILPSGNLFYSNFLSVGKELDWQVSVLDWSGNESLYFDAYINDTLLSQGDNVKLTVTHEPNTLPINLKAEGEWLNISINGREKQYHPSDVHIGAHTWMYGDFFTSPVIQKIEDDSIKLFEEYYAHVKSTEEYNNTEYYTDVGEMYSILLINTEFLLFNITDTLFKETFYYCEYFNAIDNRYENEEESLFKLYSVLYESVIDIERGTIFSYKYYIDSVYNFTSVLKENEYAEDHYYLLIENTDKTTGYTNDITSTDPALSYDTIFGINVNYIVIGVAIYTSLYAAVGWVFGRKKEQRIKQVEKRQIAGFVEEIKRVIQPQEKEKNKTKTPSTEDTVTKLAN
ncbi:MAG: hypothetical protein KGD64_12060 [Candidatus Heimdallarchaeota archaeon]|nr:hypothetical protein [Candidatus Heimdallarchaeota archaeon]